VSAVDRRERSRGGFLIVATVALLLATHTTSSASEESERITAGGLVEFHDGRYDDALATLDRAVEADADDAEALYYRGLTHGRLGRYDAAAADLQRALEISPDMDRAALELGYALYRTEQYAAAERWLEQAQRTEELAGRASLLLGIVQLRLDKHDDARRNLARAEAAAPALVVPARYYRGVASYRQGEWQRAEDHFDFVRAEAAGTDMARQADTYLAELDASKGRSYQLYGTLGFEYDSNVPLLSSDGQTRRNTRTLFGFNDSRDDGRNTLTTGIWYVPVQKEKLQVSMNYEFFQSLHYDLNNFNIQNHRTRVGLASSTERMVYGLSGEYDFYLQETNRFLGEVRLVPWVRFPLDPYGETELYYRMRHRDYLKSGFHKLDGWNHALGLRHTYYFGAAGAWLSGGYRFDHEEPESDRSVAQQFGYDGHQAELTFGWQLPFEILGESTYTYRFEDYDGASSGREDNEQFLSITLRRRINDFLSITGGYYGRVNQSDDNRAPAPGDPLPLRDPFEYDQHIGQVALEARY